jgi:hypothetical protein
MYAVTTLNLLTKGRNAIGILRGITSLPTASA